MTPAQPEPAATTDAPATTADLSALDWRYLLPTPPKGRFRHLAFFGAAPGTAQCALTAGLADRVSDNETARGDADAVVAFLDAAWPLDRVLGALAEDAVLYIEYDRSRLPRPRPGPRRMAQRLSANHLDVSGSYAVVVRDGRYRSFIPLNVAGAMRWFVTTRHVPRSLPGVAFEYVARFALRVAAGRAGSLLPRTATIAGRGSFAGAPSAALAAAGNALRNDAKAPLLSTLGGERVIVFPFAEHTDEPGIVVKVPRMARFNANNEHEHSVLEDLRRRVPSELLPSIPEPLSLRRVDGLVVATERYMPGAMLTRTCGHAWRSSREKARDLLLAADWLTRFQSATRGDRRSWGDSAHAAWLLEPLQQFRSVFGTTDDEQKLFTAAESAGEAASRVVVPTVWQHRDFSVWNLTRLGGSLHVLDWEGARLGPPLADLLRLLTSWFTVTRYFDAPDGELLAFRDTLDVLFGLADAEPAARAVLRRYVDEVGVDMRLRLPLLVHYVVELALRREEQKRAHGSCTSNARLRNDYVALVAALAASHQRFSAGRDGD